MTVEGTSLDDGVPLLPDPLEPAPLLLDPLELVSLLPDLFELATLLLDPLPLLSNMQYFMILRVTHNFCIPVQNSVITIFASNVFRSTKDQ